MKMNRIIRLSIRMVAIRKAHLRNVKGRSLSSRCNPYRVSQHIPIANPCKYVSVLQGIQRARNTEEKMLIGRQHRPGLSQIRIP